MSDLVFSELAGDILVPTIGVETDWTTGRKGLPTLGKKLLLTGYQLAAGSATVGQVLPCGTTAKAIEYWGAGSHLAVMVEAALLVSPRIPIYGMSYTESAGLVATEDIVLNGAATGPGTWEVWIGGRRFAIGIENGDSLTDMGDAMVLVINAHPNLPVVASFVTATLTLDARNKGLSGNSIRIRSEITPDITTTSTDGAAVLSSGTLEGTPTTFLAAAEGDRYHIIVCQTSDEAAMTTALLYETHIAKQSTATVQKWGMVITGYTGTAANANTAAGLLDNKRCQVVSLPSCDAPEFELGAAFGALRCAEVNRNVTLDYRELKGIKAPYDETVWNATDDEQLALLSGVVPIRPLRTGTVEVVRNVTTWVTGNANPKIPDAEPIEISDYVDEDLIASYKRVTVGKSLKVSSPAGTPNVITPARLKLVLHERMRLWDQELDYTQGAESAIEAEETQAYQNASDVSRADVGYPFEPVFGLHVLAVKKTFTTPDL